MTKPADTPCDVKAYALIDVLTYMLAGIKKNTHARRNAVVKALVKTLADRLLEVKAKTVTDTLGHVENYSLVNKFTATLAELKAKTIDATLHDFQAEALADMTAETLPEVSASILPTY